MNSDVLRKKLLASAKVAPPSEHVPYAFEKRIMTSLQKVQAVDPWAFCSRLLWKAAAPSLAIMFMAVIVSSVLGETLSNPAEIDYEIDTEVISSLGLAGEDW